MGMAFVVDRPRQILNVPLNPFYWGVAAADLFSFGVASSMLQSLQAQFNPSRGSGVDLVTAFIDVSNLLTGGLAERELCVSKRTLEIDFLTQHFTQHYEMIVGATSTWNQVADWLDPASIPSWVRKGVLG